MSKFKMFAVAGVIVVAGAAWYAFRPELLFVNSKADDKFPAAGQDAKPAAIESGSFHGVAHATKGTATVYRLAKGDHILRLTDFETSNGPDVHVYLVAAPDADDSDTVKAADVLDLGSLKGNLGDQNYELPENVDLNKYRSVSTWCKRFAVNFATAPLAKPAA